MENNNQSKRNNMHPANGLARNQFKPWDYPAPASPAAQFTGGRNSFFNAGGNSNGCCQQCPCGDVMSSSFVGDANNTGAVNTGQKTDVFYSWDDSVFSQPFSNKDAFTTPTINVFADNQLPAVVEMNNCAAGPAFAPANQGGQQCGMPTFSCASPLPDAPATPAPKQKNYVKPTFLQWLFNGMKA